jgi:hypothetical protein
MTLTTGSGRTNSSLPPTLKAGCEMQRVIRLQVRRRGSGYRGIADG